MAKRMSEKDKERAQERFMMGWRTFGSSFQVAMICASVVACVICIFFLPVYISHGETTTITVANSFVSNLQLNVAISWVLTGVAGLWGYLERKLRYKERAERDARIREFERSKDPNVTSSGLSVRGEKTESGSQSL